MVFLQNIVLSGGSTMFKDFQRRLQRDIKKLVDARSLASETRSGGDLKVGCLLTFCDLFSECTSCSTENLLLKKLVSYNKNSFWVDPSLIKHLWNDLHLCASILSLEIYPATYVSNNSSICGLISDFSMDFKCVCMTCWRQTLTLCDRRLIRFLWRAFTVRLTDKSISCGDLIVAGSWGECGGPSHAKVCCLVWRITSRLHTRLLQCTASSIMSSIFCSWDHNQTHDEVLTEEGLMLRLVQDAY